MAEQRKGSCTLCTSVPAAGVGEEERRGLACVHHAAATAQHQSSQQGMQPQCRRLRFVLPKDMLHVQSNRPCPELQGCLVIPVHEAKCPEGEETAARSA